MKPRVKVVCTDGTYLGTNNGVFMPDGTRVEGVSEIHFHIVPDGVAVVDLKINAPTCEFVGMLRDVEFRVWPRFLLVLKLFVVRLTRQMVNYLRKGL